MLIKRMFAKGLWRPLGRSLKRMRELMGTGVDLKGVLGKNPMEEVKRYLIY